MLEDHKLIALFHEPLPPGELAKRERIQTRDLLRGWQRLQKSGLLPAEREKYAPTPKPKPPTPKPDLNSPLPVDPDSLSFGLTDQSDPLLDQLRRQHPDKDD
jgi:hypothetical protein